MYTAADYFYPVDRVKELKDNWGLLFTQVCAVNAQTVRK